MEEISANYTVRIVESFLVVTHSSSVASHEVDIYEQEICTTLVDEEINYLHLPLFSNHSSNLNLEYHYVSC